MVATSDGAPPLHQRCLASLTLRWCRRSVRPPLSGGPAPGPTGMALFVGTTPVRTPEEEAQRREHVLQLAAQASTKGASPAASSSSLSLSAGGGGPASPGAAGGEQGGAAPSPGSLGPTGSVGARSRGPSLVSTACCAAEDRAVQIVDVTDA